MKNSDKIKSLVPGKYWMRAKNRDGRKFETVVSIFDIKDDGRWIDKGRYIQLFGSICESRAEEFDTHFPPNIEFQPIPSPNWD